MTELSPETQTVLDAAEVDFQVVFNDIETGIADFRRRTAAAALRAAAMTLSNRWSSDECIEQLVVIASELENYRP